MSQVNPLTQLLDASHNPNSEPEALDRLAAYAIAALVAKGVLTQAEAGDAYFEEAVDRTLNLRVPAWGDEGWLQWTEGEEPVRL